MEMDLITLEYATVDEIPIAFCKPSPKLANGTIALWIPYLGGDKSTGLTELQALAEAGYFAISFDPIQHGERHSPQEPDIRSLVFQNFRAVMWNILGTTVLDAFRVLDWAVSKYKLNNDIVVGGISMGGDIAVSLAGIDKRVRKVAAIAASPDWMRPGMTDVMDSTKVIVQGNPTPFGTWLYSQLDPLTNLGNYGHAPQILFELGEADTHISPLHALGFKEKLSEKYQDSAAAIEIHINSGADHLTVIQDHAVLTRCIQFLLKK